jgi:hypothetical protein
MGVASDWFEPLDPDLVRLQIEDFQQLETQLKQEWEEECHKYEELMLISVDGRSLQVPMRNYANPSGTIMDDSLYPYHNSLYPLLDAYDALYLDNTAKHPISKNSIHPCLVPIDRRLYEGLREADDDEDEMDGFAGVESHTPVSVQCLAHTLLQKRFHCCSYGSLAYLMQAALDKNQSFFTKLTSMKAQAALMGDNAFYAAAAQEDIVEQNEEAWIREDYGHEHLPLERSHRASILLKVLKHAMSEVQRDERLASAVSILLARHHDLDDTNILSRFLSILCSEYLVCTGECEYVWNEQNPPTHFCMEHHHFDNLLSQILAYGITVMKEHHVNVLAGFVRYAFNREFGHLLNKLDDDADVNEKRSRFIKRTVVARRMEDEDEFDVDGGTKVPVDLVINVIYGLGIRGSAERHRLIASLGNDSVALEPLTLALTTFKNCLRALVDIGEACILFLPASDRFYTLASVVVRNMCSILADSVEPLVQPTDEGIIEPDEYFGIKDSALNSRRMCVSSRLADCITDATELLRNLEPTKPPDSRNPRDILLHEIRQVCCARPPSDVRDAVRGLFVREMVDVREAGLGYSDFLVWCRYQYDVTPLDPVIFVHGTSIPCEEEDSDDSSSDDDSDDDSSMSGEARAMAWDTDEDDHVLTRGEQRARYDFSLMLLLRAWQAPWKPRTHYSFQPEFRGAAKCIMQCTHHLSMPKEIGQRIIEYLPRSFWPDDRNQCWNFECPDSVASLLKKVQGNRSSTTNIQSVLPCSKCHIPIYCSESCRKTDWKEDHKRFCKVPPFCKIGPFEERFIASISNESADGMAEVKHVDSEDGDVVMKEAESDKAVEDNEEDWSDIDSQVEDDQPVSRTQRIYRFFEEKTYTPRNIDD